jgi:predicted transposase YbfD/YdcC
MQKRRNLRRYPKPPSPLVTLVADGKGLLHYRFTRRRKEVEGTEARLVNIDGKTIRESGVQVVSAWIGEHGLTLGQVVTEEQSNEIKVVLKLLDILDVEGDVVTADVMSCQKEIAKKIREQGTEYVLAVKENQKGLYEDIWPGEEKQGHGCFERREAWEDLTTIIPYRTFQREKGNETVQTDRYYISSGDFSADAFLKYIRGHWSIENQLHWMPDIVEFFKNFSF